MKQYNQHPDTHGCTYYASATAIARDCGLELSYDDLKAIAELMKRYRFPWSKGYSISIVSKVIIKYIKDKYNKDIGFKRTNVYTYEGKSMVLFSSKIDAGYIIDIKDGVFDGDMPSKGGDHMRCMYIDDNGDKYMVENFLGLVPYNIIKFGKRVPKGIKTVGYIYYNK